MVGHAKKASSRSRAIMSNQDRLKDHETTLRKQADFISDILKVVERHDKVWQAHGNDLAGLYARVRRLETPFWRRWWVKMKGNRHATDKG